MQCDATRNLRLFSRVVIQLFPSLHVKNNQISKSVLSFAMLYMYQRQLSFLVSIFLAMNKQLVVKGAIQIYYVSTTRRKGMGSNATVFVATDTHIHSTLEIKLHRRDSSMQDFHPFMHVSSLYLISYPISIMYAPLTIYICRQHCAGLCYVYIDLNCLL